VTDARSADACAMHVVVLHSEKAKYALASRSFAGIAATVYRKASAAVSQEVSDWLSARAAARARNRISIGG
jgi:hypothetical protein